MSEGTLNFGKIYTNLDDYKASEAPEKSGSLAVVKFKVLAEGQTSLSFEDTATMPNAISGTMLFDWNGIKLVSGYKVVQPEKIIIEKSEVVVTPVPTSTAIVTTPTPTAIVVTPTPTAVVTTPTPTAIVTTPTPTAVVTTPTPTTIVTSPTPSDKPTATPTPALSSYITIEFDKTNAEVGEIVKAAVKVNKIMNFAGYQINLKFDPDVLQPIKPSGSAYSNSTIPSSGTLIANSEFSPINAVSHNLSKGIMNFAKMYTMLEYYRMSDMTEETGTIAVIEFKVLKDVETFVKFENSSTMPNGKDGTMLFNADGDRILSGYSVIQPAKIN